MNKTLIFSIVTLILVGIGVSRIKYEVVFLRKNLKTLQIETEQCLDDIKVLGAEWSYLNNPNRLIKLAQKYLPDMKPIGNKQIIGYKRIIGVGLTSSEKVKDEKKKSSSSSFDALLDGAIGG